MQLGTQLPWVVLGDPVVRTRADELFQVALAWLEDPALLLLLKARQINRVAIEGNDLNRLLGPGATQHVATFHQQVGVRVLFDDARLVGEIR